jgi:GT2 family glycosyltransferase
MKKLAILLPVHNGLNYTINCLRLLESMLTQQSSSHLDISIIVIDDGSTDGTAEWTGKNMPAVIVVKGNGNLWWSGAVNAGARYAMETLSAEYVLLWNNDIIPSDDYFIRLEEIISHEQEDRIIGSKIYQAKEKNIIWSFGGYFNPCTGNKLMIGFGKTDNNEFGQVLKVDWLTGMGTIVPTRIIKEIGYWDNINFPQYHGDSDFTYRATIHGFQVIAHPSLRIWNDTSNTGIQHNDSVKGLFRMLTDIKSQYNIKKNIMFYRKYAKTPWACLPLLAGYFRLLSGFLKWKILGLLKINRKTC